MCAATSSDLATLSSSSTYLSARRKVSLGVVGASGEVDTMCQKRLWCPATVVAQTRHGSEVTERVPQPFTVHTHQELHMFTLLALSLSSAHAYDYDTVGSLPSVSLKADLVVELFQGQQFDNGNDEVDYLVVKVTNEGVLTSGSCWADIFFGETRAPSMGDLSDIYYSIPALASGESHTIWVPAELVDDDYADVIVDSTQRVDELSERNNIESLYMYIAD